MKPLSTLEEGQPVTYDATADFVVLCANCHRLHEPHEAWRRRLDGRVVDISALRALAPPSLRPRSQAITPPAPHAAPRWSRRHSFQCQAVPEDGGIEDLGEDLDAGGTVSWWIRSEGCGSVQFTNFGWPRNYNFDSGSGELIGFARLDDISDTLPGTPCISGSWVAGEIRQSCDDEVVTICHSLPN